MNITARAEDDWEETGAAHGRIAVTISASRGGTVSPMFDSLPYLGSRTLIFTPDDGFRVADVRVDGTSIGAVESYAIQNATADVTVEVVFAPVGGAAETFTDVPQDAWYREAVDYVTGTGLFQGTSDRAFSPDGRMTRAMLAAVLYRAAGEPSIEDEIWGYPFADVEAGSWYGTAVYWARLKGILSGYSDEAFGPDDPVTREQLAAMLYRYAGEPDASGELIYFSDADQISPWAADALKWAVGEGIVSGRDEGVLDPKGFATRAEVSAMLLRYLNGVPAQN